MADRDDDRDGRAGLTAAEILVDAAKRQRSRAMVPAAAEGRAGVTGGGHRGEKRA